ncbi:MAG: heterodisulfide reductase-related iron-sulfur binding cluster [Anaerolineales bacterium]
MSAETVVSQLSEAREQRWQRVRDFFTHVIAQVRILKKTYPGVMHAMLFWGVGIQVIGTLINLLNMALFQPWVIEWPRSGWYLGYELVMDIAGVMILIGVGMAAFRRYMLKPKYLASNWDDGFALVMLTLIVLAGYTNEATRLLSTQPAWGNWSPIGNWFAGALAAVGVSPQQAGAWHDASVYVHATLAMALVASIPFTKMRHLVYVPLNILKRPVRKTGEIEKIEDIENRELLGVGKVSEFTSQQLLSFDACLRCGRCEDACPSNFSGMAYSPKDLIQSMRAAMLDNLVAGGNGTDEAELMASVISEDYPWQCTTCGACVQKCPAFINPIDEIVDLRRYQILTTGQMPKSVGDTMRNFERQGNPWGMPPENRMAWAEGLDVRELAPGDETDVLFFTGCAAAFDERNKKVARAFVKLMHKAGVDFAVLGFDEMCCGETARRMGHEYLFQEFARQNIEVFGSVKFKRVVTTCPHCFNTLKNEYPQMGGDFEVLHYSELLAELALTPTQGEGRGVRGRVTYHDSCYLGRYNNIYKQPRELLKNADVNLVEMARSGENSFCCGGGGGQMWLEVDASTRINHRRLADSVDADAEVVATACPYCLLMFDDAIRSKGMGEQIKVMDIVEVLETQFSEVGES